MHPQPIITNARTGRRLSRNHRRNHRREVAPWPWLAFFLALASIASIILKFH